MARPDGEARTPSSAEPALTQRLLAAFPRLAALSPTALGWVLARAARGRR